MKINDTRTWLSRQYPVSIICDRFDGIYSGGKWVAFPLRFEDIPTDVNSNDLNCIVFWDNYDEPYGIGDSPDAAFTDLMTKMASL